MLKAFHLSLIKLFLERKFFIPSNIYFPDLVSNADSPIMTIGRFDFLILEHFLSQSYLTSF